MALDDVQRGDPHVQAHNDERHLINDLLAGGGSGGSSPLPSAGSYSYDNGNVVEGPLGETYTYNEDDTVATVSFNGTTRTFTYNPDGTIASVV